MKEKEQSREEYRKMSSTTRPAAPRGENRKPSARSGQTGGTDSRPSGSRSPREKGGQATAKRRSKPVPKDALQQTLNGSAPGSSGIKASQIAVIVLLCVIAVSLLAATLFLFKPGKIQIWDLTSVSGGDTVIQRLDPPEMSEDPVVPAETAAQAVKPVTPPEEKETPPAPGSRDTRIYFVKVNAEGQISLKSVNRTIDFSKAPLTQTINTLISGPASDELNKGSLTLIPEGSRLLSARVEGGTAYLNFNEDFRFNPLGREGYMAQLKQIVFTSTEFPGINDVQIMIEGVIREYLGGEGFYIGAPLSRESFQNNP